MMKKIKRILLVPSLLLLCAGVVFVGCGGGGGGGGPKVGAQNKNFSVGGTVAGLEGTLILQNNGGDDLTIQADGPFTFATVLARNAAYDVTVLDKSPIQNVAVINGKGTINNTDIVNINVVCTDRWMHPLTLIDNMSPDGQGVYDVSTAIDDQGNALVVWRQSDGTNSQIFKSEYTARGWSHPADLFDNISPDGQDVECPSVAMNAAGDAVIAWSQHDGTHLQIFVSQRESGIWTHPVDLTDSISPPGKNASDVQVAIDDNGDAIVAWSQSDSSNQLQIFKSEYRAGAWKHPTGLTDNISPDGQPVWPASVAMDNLGNAIIAWPQKDGANWRIYLSEYRSGQWVDPTLLEAISPAGENAWFPALAMDDAGNAIIAWPQFDGADLQIFMSEYRSGLWSHPMGLLDNISPDGEYTFDPTVAMDNNGNAIIAWYQSDGTHSQIFMSEYRGGSWTHPLDLDDNISPDPPSSSVPGANAPHVAMGDNGEAVIVWRQSDGSRYQVFKREFRETLWFEPIDILDNISPDGESVYEPHVATNDSGETLVVWRQSDGATSQAFKSEFR